MQTRGLFRRLYLAFVLTTFAAVAAAGVGAWALAQGLGNEWAANTLEQLGTSHDTLAAALDDPEDLSHHIAELEAATGTEIGVFEARGAKLAGHGPPKISRRIPLRRLARGQPVLRKRSGEVAPFVMFPLHVEDELAAVVYVHPHDRPWLWALLASGTVILGCLAVGASIVSRSLARRIEALRGGAERIATGELSHRLAPPPGHHRDELDVLGASFNHMAERIEQLVMGQRMLLANVSHELRTPLARIRVLLEILQEHGDALTGAHDPALAPRLERIRKGLREIGEDASEIETLVTDLLTSGRLELGPNVEQRPVELAPLAERLAARFGAVASPLAPAIVSGDAMLLERLLSNLLSNARRVCPSGRLTVSVTEHGGNVEVAVEDEGPGIPPEAREAVFEPFRRLDHARTRDRGGVGLGLYLCRQIATAHAGTIAASDRLDGRSGARMVVTLPRRASTAA